MVAALVPLLGAAARIVGGRVAAQGLAQGATRQVAAGRAAQFGGAALQVSGIRGAQRREDVGASRWAKDNPGEATVGAIASGMLTGPGLFDSAANDFDSIAQAGQFNNAR